MSPSRFFTPSARSAAISMASMRGAAVIYPSPSFDPGQVLASIEEERCTALYGVPAMFAAELNHPRFAKFDVTSLRTGIIAGAPCPETLMRRVVVEMHLPELVTAFGMTETSAAGLATARDDPLERRVRTVGRITAHTEIKIVDDRGEVVPRGVAGELFTRGFSVMLGYWGDAQATAEAIDAEGWMHTGDLVAIDEQGYGACSGGSRRYQYGRRKGPAERGGGVSDAAPGDRDGAGVRDT